MSWLRLPVLLASAAVVGLVVARLPAEEGRVSVDLWLAATAAWAAFLLLRRSLAPIPAAPIHLRAPFRVRTPEWFGGGRPDTTGRTPRDLGVLEGLLLSSVEQQRAFERRLRPRLRKVVAHRLRVARGVDLDTEPDRAEAVLGDLAWLVDPEPADRAPTIEELTRLLDRIDGDPIGPTDLVPQPTETP